MIGRILRYLGLAILIFLGIFLILNLPLIFGAPRLYQSALAGKRNLEEAATALGNKDFVAASEAADRASGNFSNCSKVIDDFRDHKFWRNFSYSQDALSEWEYLLKTAEVLSRAVARGSLVAEKIDTVLAAESGKSFNDLSDSKRREILRLLYESGPELNGLKADVDLAAMDLRQVSGQGFLGILKGQIAMVRDKLIMGSQMLSQGLVLSQILPQAAGYPQAANYLLILQNSDELRPTGGFIGTLGVMQVKNGQISSIQTHDSYHLDMPASVNPNFKVVPPWPIKKYMKVENWYLRDANWSPDWPTSAKQIEWAYKTEAPFSDDPTINPAPNFDGVLAVTPEMVTDLLGIVGPITVDGQEYNQGNFVELLQYEVEMAYRERGESQWDRKKVVGEIFGVLKERLFNLPSSRYPELLQVLSSSIYQKDILVYFNDRSLQNIARNLGWSGEVKPATGDYLFVVDSNLAAFKTDRVMEKTIRYSLIEKDDGLYAKVRIDYRHGGGFDWKTTRYRSYTRIYVPQGSKLLKSSGYVDGSLEVKDDNFDDISKSKTYFGAFLSIEPGEEGYLEFEYQLPISVYNQVQSGDYNLLVQKQPGNRARSLDVDLDFSADIDSFSGSYNQMDSSSGGRLEAVSDLGADQDLSLKFD